MVKKYRVGQLRPSQILFSYGVGAVADLINFSVLIMGLDEWSHATLELNEERLLAEVKRKLTPKVNKLCSPPIPSEETSNSMPGDEASLLGIPVAPFPSWMVCPYCKLLAPLQSGLFQIKSNRYRPEQTRYVHENCNARKGRKAPTVIPVRFLVACEKGHLDEFPWHYFVHRGQDNCKGLLRLEESGISGSTTEIYVRCTSCNVSPRPLSDAFGELGKENLPQCRGRNPHLRTFDDNCDQQMKALLLGASNSWFPIVLSALSLPTGSQKIDKIVDKNWPVLQKANSPENLEAIVGALQAMGQLQELMDQPQAEIWRSIQKKREGVKSEDHMDLKTPEWKTLSHPETAENTPDFQLKSVDPPAGFEIYFTRTVLVETLREVRALIGFTRIQSSGDFEDTPEIPKEYRGKLSRQEPDWVPASEVRGEGIFLQLAETKLREWENLPAVQQQAPLVREAQKNWANSRGLDSEKVRFPGMRYLLIHSFTHALMRQLSIECGYNAASLKERIYSCLPEEEKGPQAGVLIYTAAADSEGTLGGLVNLGRPKILGYHIATALESMKICASDPLCAENAPDSNNYLSLHWAACHACLFAPETACERGNKFLDRRLLVKTMTDTESLAFFV